MLVTTDKMPANARIWIYQSDRILSSDEEKKITELAHEFLNSWTAHNQELKSSFEIRYHAFLVIMIDENFSQASGCSIDKQLHFIQKLEKELSVSLLDRFVFALKENNGVKLIRRKEFESLVENGVVNDETIVFNNLVQTKRELEEKWETRFADSWHRSVYS
jgi:hypothetical protein